MSSTHPSTAPSSSGRQLAGAEAENLRVVLGSYDAIRGSIASGWDEERMLAHYAPELVDHAPHIPGHNWSGLRTVIQQYRSDEPQIDYQVERSLVDGDYVTVQGTGRRTPDDAGDACIELFRLVDGRIAEHWVVMQSLRAE